MSFWYVRFPAFSSAAEDCREPAPLCACTGQSSCRGRHAREPGSTMCNCKKILSVPFVGVLQTAIAYDLDMVYNTIYIELNEPEKIV